MGVGGFALMVFDSCWWLFFDNVRAWFSFKNEEGLLEAQGDTSLRPCQVVVQKSGGKWSIGWTGGDHTKPRRWTSASLGNK